MERQERQVCGKCGASFDTEEELDRHVQEAHPMEEPAPTEETQQGS